MSQYPFIIITNYHASGDLPTTLLYVLVFLLYSVFIASALLTPLCYYLIKRIVNIWVKFYNSHSIVQHIASASRLTK